jgi:hypothetical protein
MNTLVNAQMEINLKSSKTRKHHLVSLASDLGSHAEFHPRHVGEIVAEMLPTTRTKMIEILKREFSNVVSFIA